MSEILIFTPLLHGLHNSADLDDGMIHCSVHVGVRLTPHGTKPEATATLTDFPIMVDWPANLPEVSISIRIGSGPPVKASITGIVPNMASTVWQKVFPPSTLVYPYEPPPPLPSEANDLWFDAAKITSRVQTHYMTAAKNYIQPTKATLLKAKPTLLKSGPTVSKTGPFKTMEFLGAAPLADPVVESAKNFFSGPKISTGSKVSLPTPKEPDFHDVVGYLHQTPKALHALGLIFEIVAPRPEGMTPATMGSITLDVQFLTTASTFAKPEIWTPTVKFSKPPTRADGFEDPGQLQIIPYDPTHAAHAYSGHSGEDLHALRSSGMALIRLPVKGASGALVSANMSRIRCQMTRMKAYSATNQFDLQLSDLVAGHRIDVWDGKAWRSLCRVDGSAGRNGAALPIDDEGILSSNVTVDPGGAAVRANDTLAYWNGWSLCATRPGYVTESRVESSGATAGVRVSRSAKPGTLPALRFGMPYTFRARLVDIAGNSLPPDTTAPGAAPNSSGPRDVGSLGAPVLFLRLEPVCSPALVFAQSPGLGESSTQIVVRTSAALPPTPIRVFEDSAIPVDSATPAHGVKPVESFKASQPVSAPSGHDSLQNQLPGRNKTAPAATSMRYILPPETTVDMAEKHYVFDSSPGLISVASFSKIKAGSLWNANRTLPTTQFPKKSDVFEGQTYPGGPPEIPYLPDAACDGITAIALDNGVALGVDNGSARPMSFRSGTEYPGNYKAVSLNVFAGAKGAAGSISLVGRGIEVVLPPGERVTLGLASTLTPEAVPKMGLGQWAQATMTGVTQANYLENLQAGLVTAVTPHRQISLIHAVQQPLTAPVVRNGTFQQGTKNDTIALLSYGVSYDVKTTATLTIEAAWTEWVDHGPATAAPRSDAMTAHVATLVVPTDLVEPFSTSYVFGDTKARSSLTLSGIAVSSFAEFFPTGTDCTLRSVAPVSVPRLATAPPSQPRLAYAIPTFKWLRELTGTTGPYASTRLGNALRIYLERPWYTSGDGELLAVVVGNESATSTATHSQWGADPLAAAVPPPGGSVSFLFRSEGNLHPQVAASLPGSNENVLFYAFDVEYDALTDRYFADVTFDPATFDPTNSGGAYRPFVQLEIAAYQPNAIPGCQLSAPITVPFTQIFPDRTLTIDPYYLETNDTEWGRGLKVVLKGVGPQLSTPGVYTPDTGRGIGTQIDIRSVFSEVYNYNAPPGSGQNPLKIKGSASASTTPTVIGGRNQGV